MFVLFYIIALVISIILMRLKGLNKVTIIVISTLFGLIAMLMTAKRGFYVDSSFYYDELSQIRALRPISSVSQLFSEIVGKNGALSNAPIIGIALILFSYLPQGYFLFAVAFIDIFCILGLLKKSSLFFKKNNIQINNLTETIAWIIIISLFNFTYIIPGVRTGLVSSAFCYCIWSFYQSRSGNKWIKLVLVSTILVLIHPFFLILLIISILVMVTYNRFSELIIACLLLLQHFYQPILLNLLTPLKGIPYFDSILFKSNQYLGGDNALIQATSSNSYIRSILQLGVILLVYFLARNRIRDKNDFLKYDMFVLYLISFSLGSLYDQVLFGRCILSLIIAIVPYTLILINNLKIKLCSNNLLIRGIYFIVALIIAIVVIMSLIDNIRAGNVHFAISLFNFTYQ